MQNYTKILARDRVDGMMVNQPPPFVALSATTIENNTVSSVTLLNANCTAIEVTAIGVGAAIKWSNATNTTATSSVITAAGTANFDNVIPSGTVLRFVVPRSTAALAPTSVVGLNIQEGLFSGVATKSMGVGSVLLTQV